MLRLSDLAMARLERLQPELADVVKSGREMEAMRRDGVFDLDRVKLHRERVRAAGHCWGHQLRGDGAGRA